MKLARPAFTWVPCDPEPVAFGFNPYRNDPEGCFGDQLMYCIWVANGLPVALGACMYTYTSKRDLLDHPPATFSRDGPLIDPAFNAFSVEILTQHQIPDSKAGCV